MRLLSVVAVLLASACASEPAVDALELRMTMNYVERAVRPVPGNAPRTFIDGVERSIFEVEYTSDEDITKHIVELRLDNTTIRTLQVSLDSFGDRCKSDGEIRSIAQEICVYDSGDLRFGSETVDGACVTNTFCRPTCQPLHGCASSRCTSIVTSTSPLTSHLGCAPIGTQLLGQACTLIATPDGMHDDCGEHLLCVAGRCRATCGSEADCNGCANVAGHAIELRVCPL